MKEFFREEVKLRINRIDSCDKDFKYVNDLLVTHGNDKFFIKFGQSAPPDVLDGLDLEQLKKTGTIDVPVVSKLVVDPEFIPIIIRILQENYQKYQTQQEGVPVHDNRNTLSPND